LQHLSEVRKKISKNSLEGDPVESIKIGDIVTRKSYGGDIYFRVANIVGDPGQERAVLRGLVYRLCADAPLNDLERKNQIAVDVHRKENLEKQRQQIMRVASRSGKRGSAGI
jgi:spore coat assembly protein